ncbi:citrate transporter [Actinobacillus delphinicola]|uniref:SLC13 family permease n=1 Tax=Actinobacillus delphinicola TaxID=51161 RepID=UPI0024512300|nr:citrate transporter [Actinobacillus delphinicola]
MLAMLQGWNYSLILTLIFLVIAIFLFLQNKIRMDVVALLVMLAFSVSGILTLPEVFAGFSDANIILIALLFVVGEGLIRTGVAYSVSEWLLRRAKNSETRVLILLMLAVAGLGAFMSSTGVVAIFIPVVLLICRKMHISPRRLMMPLSMAALISGMLTLIATPPNLIVNAELLRLTHQRLSFFSFTPIGIVILLLGIFYMLFARRYLGDELSQEEGNSHFSIHDLIAEYHITDQMRRVVVRENSDFIGHPIEELGLRSLFGINVIAIECWKRLRSTLHVEGIGKMEIHTKDILLVDISHSDLDFTSFCQTHDLVPAELSAVHFNQQSRLLGMVEITPVPDTPYLGQPISELHLRSRYGVNIIGIKRNGAIIETDLMQEPLQTGDILLVVGAWKLIEKMRQNTKNFFMLDFPEEIEQAAPALSQAPYALFSIAVMVCLMVFGIVPNVIAALICCLMLAKFGCIDAKSAYQSLQWSSLILIIGMMPFAIALQKTGGIAFIVDKLLIFASDWHMHALLVILFVTCALVGLFISNTATAILISPIAVEMAIHLHVSPVPFVMVVAIAASSAFMTPISSPVNTMVMGLGNYKFSDFMKIGVPFTVLVMLVTVLLVPVLFPF